jgi:hypothetical protein
MKEGVSLDIRLFFITIQQGDCYLFVGSVVALLLLDLTGLP